MNPAGILRPTPTRRSRGRGLRLRAGLAALAAAALGLAAYLAWPAPDPDRLWHQARSDFQAGSVDRTEAALARLARLRRPTAADRMLRAQVAMARGRVDEALADLRGVPDGHAMAPLARLQEGQLELRRHRAHAAQSAFRRAVALDPKAVQARRELIYIYAILSRWLELHEQYRALADMSRLSYEDVLLWCTAPIRKWERGDQELDLRRFLDADPSDRATRLSLAGLLLRQGRPADTEAMLAPLPDSDVEARALRAGIVLERDGPERAEALLAGGPPDHPALAQLRGRIALKNRDAAGAVRQFRIAREADPADNEAAYGLAQALSLAGDRPAAEPFFREARLLSQLSRLLERADTAAGRRDPRLLHDLGAAYEAIGRPDEARAWFKLAISRDPLDAEAQRALYRLGRPAPARPETSPR